VTKLQGEPPAKVVKGPPAPVTEIDPTSSDHVVAMTQLKEKIASLQKLIQQKDAGLFTKDKQVNWVFQTIAA
jgi:FAM76 protein